MLALIVGEIYISHTVRVKFQTDAGIIFSDTVSNARMMANAYNDVGAGMQGASLVITGEGHIDSQTIQGKTPMGVARVAKAHPIPVIAIVGGMSDDDGIVHKYGLDAVFSVIPPLCSLAESFGRAAHNISVTARNIAAVWVMTANE